MKNSFALAAFAFSMLFVTPAAWGANCHEGSQSKSGEGTHECQQACTAEIGHERKQAEKTGGKHECQQACGEKSEHACQPAGKDDHGADVGKVMDGYFAILASLSRNSMDNVRDNAKALAEGADGLIKQCADCKGDGVKACSIDSMAGVSAAAKSLAEKTDIDSARTEFGTLSEKLVELQGKSGEGAGKLPVYRCDMAKKVWLQKDEDPGNPYFGPSMATCRHKLD